MREAEICTWLGDKKGAISFTVDDGWPGCREEMARAGFRGTYYWFGPAWRTTTQWLKVLVEEGHEIGAHSTTHLCLPSPHNETPQAFWKDRPEEGAVEAYRRDEIDPNVSVIEQETGEPVLSMAWPCGCTDPSRMKAAEPYFLGVRGYYDEVANLRWIDDVNTATPHAFLNLNASVRFDPSFVHRAAAEGKWAIITTHESTGAEGIDYIGDHLDELWAAPVGEVLKYIKVRDAARILGFRRRSGSISFTIRHDLPVFARSTLNGRALLPVVYDNPVTIKVYLRDDERVSRVTAGVTARIDKEDGDTGYGPGGGQTAGRATDIPFRAGAGYITFETPAKPARRIRVVTQSPDNRVR